MSLLQQMLKRLSFLKSIRPARASILPSHKINFEIYSKEAPKTLEVLNISLSGIAFQRDQENSWQALGTKLTGSLSIKGERFRTTVEVRHVSFDRIGAKFISKDFALDKAIENYLLNELKQKRVNPSFKKEFYELIESRKSIRKYKTDAVSKEVLERVLSAAMHAPSGKNRQNWRFFVVQGTKRDEYLEYSKKSFVGIKDVLQKRLKPSLYEFTERFFYTLGGAPVIIFCYSLNDPEERYHTSIGSVYMAAENMILAAVSEGLGTCSMGAPLEIKDDVDKFLGIQKIQIPEGSQLELLCAVVMGWPDHEPPKAPRQTEGRVTWL